VIGPSLEAAVSRLPITVDGIALFLIARGIKGIPLDRDQCPLAHYLTDETGRRVVVGVMKAWHPYEGDVVVLPPVVIDFVEQFDRGTLPRKEALLA
jgi:hypothetical protein